MKEQLELQLVKLAPIFFQEYKLSEMQSCMGRGFECGDGWFEYIAQFASDVEDLNKQLKPLHYHIVCEQFKEKFGEATCYYSINKKPLFPYIWNIKRFYKTRLSSFKFLWKEKGDKKYRKYYYKGLIHNSYIPLLNIPINIVNCLINCYNGISKCYSNKYWDDLSKQQYDDFNNQIRVLNKTLGDNCWNVCEICGSDVNVQTTKGGWLMRLCSECNKTK